MTPEQNSGVWIERFNGNAEKDASSTHIERITSELLLTDALTGNDEGTPTHYTVHADDVEYLVRTVLGLAEQIHEERVAALAAVIPSTDAQGKTCEECETTGRNCLLHERAISRPDKGNTSD